MTSNERFKSEQSSTLTITRDLAIESNAVILAIGGEITMGNCTELREAIQQALAATSILVIDFGGLTYIDSSGAGVLLVAHIKSSRRNYRLILVNIPPGPMKFFEFSGLNDAFEIVSTLEEAIAKIKQVEA